MTFGEKLKKMRAENGLTQEQLAEKIYVTRTAVSKWETDNGYPAIDSLKQLSDFFKIAIDELISDDDVKNKKLLDEKNARKTYYVAIAFLGVAVAFTLLAYFLKLPYLNVIGATSVTLYLVFAFFAKPQYKRVKARKILLPYIISRLIIFAVVGGAIIYTLVTL